MAADQAVRRLRCELKLPEVRHLLTCTEEVPTDAEVDVLAKMYVRISGFARHVCLAEQYRESLSGVLVALRDPLVLHMVAKTGYRSRSVFLQTLDATLGEDFTKQRSAELQHTYRCLFDSVPERFDSMTTTSGRRRSKKAAAAPRLRACSAPIHGRLPIPGPVWISAGVHGSVGSSSAASAVSSVAA